MADRISSAPSPEPPLPGLPPLPELKSLRRFEDSGPTAYYANGFELTEYGDTGALETWSDDPEFSRALITFAQANSTGSLYALWRLDDRPDLSTLPVIVFGDEGGVHPVARTLRELFQLLGADAALYVDHGGVSFDLSDDFEPSERHGEYVAWLKGEFGLEPATDPDAVAAAAEGELGERFEGWMRGFVDG